MWGVLCSAGLAGARRREFRVGAISALLAGSVLVALGDPAQAAPPVPATFAVGSVAVGDGGQDAVMGDVDGDGDLDLVAANGFADTVSVALGTGDGTFEADVEYVTGDQPVALAVGDVDGDGDVDVVTVDSVSDTVSVLLGNGDGSLSSPAAVGLDATPLSVTMGDVDEDGDVDLAVPVFASGVSMLLGAGDGTFASPYTVHDAVSGSSLEAALADVNGDAHLDLLTTDETAARVSVLVGDGNGSFSLLTSLSTLFDYPQSIAVADLDGDSDSDLVVQTVLDGGVSVFLGDGDGTFGARVEYLTDRDPTDVAAGDVNGDTFPDLVIAEEFRRVFVLLGNGDGTFGSSAYFCCEHSTSVVVGDVNGDAWLDVAAATFSGDSVVVMVNTVGLALDAPVATAGSNGVTVSWTPPDDDSTVTGYVVTVEPFEGYQQLPVVTYSPTTNSAVVTNLINGNTYTFKVAATNAVGAGPRSAASNAVVSATGLGPPTIGTATRASSGGIAVSWTAPAADGGSPVTGYVVTPYSGYYPSGPRTFNSTATTQTINDLVDGRTYRFRVRAINAVGSSAYSTVTNPIVASSTAPGAPTNVTAVAGDGEATVSWTAPTVDGGSSVTGYIVTPYVGYIEWPSTTFNSTATTQTITGLTNGKTYRFRVKAINAVDNSTYSKVSNPITPTP